jgi:23S rRNA (cytosine1962-C5)-methyltransferase
MFKSLEIKKSGLEKIKGEHGELYKSDVEGQVKSLTPGEWILLRDPHQKRIFLGFANPLIEDRLPAIQILTRLKKVPTEEVVEEYILEHLESSWSKRQKFPDYGQGCRVIYGQADGLPGLIVDAYLECALVQINSAGMDRWRAFIREKLEVILQRPCFFLDNPAQRSREVLPHHREELPFDALKVLENGFRYQIPAKNLQKIGWYYDHRENRRKFESALQRWAGAKERGVDLFCYGGAWGLHALRGGLKHVDFVDQAPLEAMVQDHLSMNNFKTQGEFFRSDVFDWLDKKILEKKSYDVVISDPPAFAKTPKDRTSALDGYRKLHRKVLKISRPDALVAFASCTHYVEHAAFVETIVHAAYNENRRIQILETGMQGWDHPVTSLEDRSNYIKYTLVRVE